MTATESKLVEVVARAICKAESFGTLDPDELWQGEPRWHGYIKRAQAAIAACHAEEMVKALRVVVGCFAAAYTEGRLEKLAEAEVHDVGSLPDLVNRRLLYALTAAQEALARIDKPTEQPVVEQKTPAAKPTEAMCDRARGFILGLDLGIRTFEKMREHLGRGGYPTIEYISNHPGGHITKWDVADCIYQLMTSAEAEEQPV